MCEGAWHEESVRNETLQKNAPIFALNCELLQQGTTIFRQSPSLDKITLDLAYKTAWNADQSLDNERVHRKLWYCPKRCKKQGRADWQHASIWQSSRANELTRACRCGWARRHRWRWRWHWLWSNAETMQRSVLKLQRKTRVPATEIAGLIGSFRLYSLTVFIFRCYHLYGIAWSCDIFCMPWAMTRSHLIPLHVGSD
jgi:hypothetical protein